MCLSPHHFALIDVEWLEEGRLRCEQALKGDIILSQALNQRPQVATVADVNQPLILTVYGQDPVQHGQSQHLMDRERRQG